MAPIPDKKDDKVNMVSHGLVVEDIPQTCEWLAGILSDTFDGIDVGTASNLETAHHWLKQNWGPHKTQFQSTQKIALIDLGLPDGSGISLLRKLTKHYPSVIPIVITIYDDDNHLFDAIAAGAQGYLLKDQSPDILTKYLRRIQQGEPPLSPAVAQRMMTFFQNRNQENFEQQTNEHLTTREVDVLKLLARGLRNSDVSRILKISEHTVAGYVKSIYRKLEICSRAEATLAAMNLGLLSPRA